MNWLAMLLTLGATLQTDFTMVLPVSPDTPEGRQLIARRAMEICAGSYPVLGRYQFIGNETTDARGRSDQAPQFAINQQLECRDAPPAPPAGTPVPESWQASEADNRAAIAATETYFEIVDAGDLSRYEAIMTPGQLATATTDARRRRLADFRAEAGRPGRHRAIRVTWYVNPAGVAPGAYAAVDFDRSYANLAANCGYVVWHRQSDGRLLLVREELGSAPIAVVTPERTLAAVRQMLRCRD